VSADLPLTGDELAAIKARAEAPACRDASGSTIRQTRGPAMSDDLVRTLRHGLTEQERDTDFQLDERLKAEASLALTKDALRQSLTTNGALHSTIEQVRALHLPVAVAGIEGYDSLGPFVRCSCTPGLLYEDCATVRALAGVTS
jgi:hypothetical protein